MTAAPPSLDQLHDIVMPAELPGWPPAPGWIVLALVLAIALALAAIRVVRFWRANAYRREAQRALALASTSADVVAVLRRTALAVHSRQEVAVLAGEPWAAWLAAQFPNPLPEQVARQLAEAPYRAGPDAPSRELRQFAADWIRLHRPPPAS